MLCLLSYVRMLKPPAGVEPAPRPYKGRVLAVDTTEALMETVGVEPTPPRCKRGTLPIELHPQVRTGGVEPPQPEATGLQPAELTVAQRPRVKGGRPDSNRNFEDHDLGCCRYTTTTMRRCRLRRRRLITVCRHGIERREIIMAREAGRIFRRRAGTTGLEPARARLTSECSRPLSYAPWIAPVGFEPTISSS